MSENSKEINISNNDPYVIKHDDGSYTIYSGLPEFGYELLSVIPLAWHLHQKGLLRRTISGYDTKALYWFSPQHDELDEPRSWDNVEKLLKARFPNIAIHCKQLDWSLFAPPPYKDHYQSSAIQFAKPTLIISNRINSEWNGEPINFLDVGTLNNIFALLREKYQIIYLETSHFSTKYEDHSEFDRSSNRMKGLNLSGVITFSELLKQYPGTSINELQCRLYAGCEKFISSNGGLGILASYFGGENVIFSKKCHELNPDINSFYGWYPRLSGATISVARSEPELLERIHDKWVDDLPLFNILIRTSGRPNYFHDCITSIIDQDYKNVNIIVGYDDPASEKYIQKFPCLRIPLQRWDKEVPTQPAGEQYGIWFPFNEYFNYLLPYAKQGYVVYLDDDDCFVDSSALSKLAETIKRQRADAVFWRVQFPNRLVPSEKNWLKKMPVCRDVSTIGYAHSVVIRPSWEPWKRGDFRVADFVHRTAVNPVWFDAVLTGLQRIVEDGYGKRDDKPTVDMPSVPSVTVVIPAFKATDYLEDCLDSVLAQRSDILSLQVLVGIDACLETLQMIKKLSIKYGSSVQFWRSKQNVGSYIIKNSLLRKMSRRDGLVLFFDSDDLMPKGLLKDYLNRYLDFKRKNECCVGIRINLINFPVMPFFRDDESKVRLVDNRIVEKIISSGSDSFYGRFGRELAAFHTLKYRYRPRHHDLKVLCEPAHGILLIEMKALEAVGAYNKERVLMDDDLIARLKSAEYKILVDPDASWFVRRVNDQLITMSAETDLGTSYQAKIKQKYAEHLAAGIVKASWHAVELRPVL
ncbi:glycosyltransferase [uncultured Nitrosomonas sp.]|uniref:glycosyltransferase family 2 protein n=1 Tax=uncultured Nitrosomonas sp. TaxID=156424 RepID=UPI00262ACDD7|nr:glycosyltransferase [uncultured Nitrosomonas sp.]